MQKDKRIRLSSLFITPHMTCGAEERKYHARVSQAMSVVDSDEEVKLSETFSLRDSIQATVGFERWNLLQSIYLTGRTVGISSSFVKYLQEGLNCEAELSAWNRGDLLIVAILSTFGFVAPSLAWQRNPTNHSWRRLLLKIAQHVTSPTFYAMLKRLGLDWNSSAGMYYAIRLEPIPFGFRADRQFTYMQVLAATALINGNIGLLSWCVREGVNLCHLLSDDESGKHDFGSGILLSLLSEDAARYRYVLEYCLQQGCRIGYFVQYTRPLFPALLDICKMRCAFFAIGYMLMSHPSAGYRFRYDPLKAKECTPAKRKLDIEFQASKYTTTVTPITMKWLEDEFWAVVPTISCAA